MSVNVAIAGATGAVGQEFLTVLAERNFPIKNLKLLASARSAGKSVEFAGKTYQVEELRHDSFKDVQIAFFSAGGSISKEFAPSAVKAGATSLSEPADMFWGDRMAQVKDQFGNQWSIATHKEDVPPQEMQKRMEAAMKPQA